MSSADIARTTYDAAHEHFDASPLRFWERYGRRTIDRLRLAPGARVLDVCCGTGASALAAARVVGPSGSVLGIDISAGLLDRARAKAKEEGISNVVFEHADMESLAYAESSFDAVVVVFGIFFAPDMQAQIERLHRLVRPGGVLAVTCWGGRLFAPLYGSFLESVRARRPFESEYRPWDRIQSREDMNALLEAAPFRGVSIEVENDDELVERPEDWWTIVLGTGLRWFVDRLDPAEAAGVRSDCLEDARHVRSIATNVIYAVAQR